MNLIVQCIRRCYDNISKCTVLFLLGVYKAYHRRARELWSDRDGQPVFRAVMSYKRFAQLKSALRFDDVARRNRDEVLSPIKDIIDKFNLKLRQFYTPGPHLCIDEMLVEFHGKVRFRQYIPSKPGRYTLVLCVYFVYLH